MISSSIDERKREARERALVVRGGCDPAAGPALGEHLLREFPPPPGAAVSAFWPLPGELDLRPMLHVLAGRGHRIGLPVTLRRGLPLVFREWRPGATLVRGRFGTLHPEGPELRPDFVLAPLLAFDRAGRRLGYGGGFYDRTLAGLPGVVAVGCAFAALEVEEVPTDETDFSLDAVATERGVIRFGRNKG